jgi:hypothetical protein
LYSQFFLQLIRENSQFYPSFPLFFPKLFNKKIQRK